MSRSQTAARGWERGGACLAWTKGSQIEKIIDFHFMMYIFQGRQVPYLYDLYDLYDLAHVAGGEPFNLHDLRRVSWVESVPYTSCTTSHMQIRI